MENNFLTHPVGTVGESQIYVYDVFAQRLPDDHIYLTQRCVTY